MAERLRLTPQDLNQAGWKAEVVTDPESPKLKAFHRMLTRIFRPGEVEPLAVFQAELGKPNFIFTEVERPISGAYGSVEGDILAIRFTSTEIMDRGTGVSQEADRKLIEKAREICQQQGQQLRGLVAECVWRSESYWNDLEIEPDNGMRRLYRPTRTGKLQQIFYTIPPLEWNPDGTSATEPIKENLQVAIAGYPKQVPTKELAQILRTWWQGWYIRPQDQFESDQAWQRHQDTVWNTLESRVIQPISKYENLTLLSKAERKALQTPS